MTLKDERWIYGAALICICFCYIYPLTLATPLLDPDEGLHAVIAQGMVETGDYMIPKLQGEVFRDKPILYFAVQALSLRVFGMNEAAVRLPGVFFTLLGVATTWLLAHRLFGPDPSRFTLLVSLTLLIPMSIAQAGIHDIALVPWLNLMLLCLWELESQAGSRQSWPWFLGGVACCALTILTKGLIGVAIVAVGYGSFLLLSRRQLFSGSIHLTTIVLLGMLLASPWFLSMEAVSPGYLRYYFYERHVLGFATDTQTHGREPWFYYLPVLIGGTMPWGLYALVGSGWNASRSDFTNQRPLQFTVCWLLGGLLFLSVAHSKLVTYSLPLFPAVAILAGLGWQRYNAGELSSIRQRMFDWLLTSTGFAGIVTPIAGVVFVATIGPLPVPPAIWIGALLLASISALMVSQFRRSHVAKAVSLGAIWMSLSLALLMNWPGQIVAEQFSARSLGLWLRVQDEFPDQIILVGRRANSAIFYLSTEQRQRLRDDLFLRMHNSNPEKQTGVPEHTPWAAPERSSADTLLQAFAADDTQQINVGHKRILQSASIGRKGMAEFTQ